MHTTSLFAPAAKKLSVPKMDGFINQGRRHGDPSRRAQDSKQPFHPIPSPARHGLRSRDVQNPCRLIPVLYSVSYGFKSCLGTEVYTVYSIVQRKDR